MVVTSNAQELRLALLSLFATVTDANSIGGCGELLDAAAALASTANTGLAKAAGVGDLVPARFGAARLLNGLCGACGRCPRGLTGETPMVMARSLAQDRPERP